MAKKPANGEGSTPYKRKDGRWCARYTSQTVNGAKRKAVYGKTRAEAAQKLAKALANQDKGLAFDAGNLTVGEYLSCWLEDSVKDSVKAATYESYEKLSRVHLIPALGHQKLKMLTPPHLRGLYRSKLDNGLSPRTVQYIHAVLNRALKAALNDGLIPRNVCTAVDPPRVYREEIKPLDPEQVQALFDAAKGDRLEALYILAVTT